MLSIHCLLPDCLLMRPLWDAEVEMFHDRSLVVGSLNKGTYLLAVHVNNFLPKMVSVISYVMSCCCMFNFFVRSGFNGSFDAKSGWNITSQVTLLVNWWELILVFKFLCSTRKWRQIIHLYTVCVSGPHTPSWCCSGKVEFFSSDQWWKEG